MSRSEIISTMAGFLVAAHHTTACTMVNATLALLRFPQQRARLISHPELARSAWEETLRYDAPIHFRHRYASGAMSVNGTPIEAGQLLFLCIQSANRDPRRFEDPDNFIIDRPNNKHFGFGGDGHFCIGAQYARLVGQIVLERLFARLPNMQIKSVQTDDLKDLSFPFVTRLDVSLR